VVDDGMAGGTDHEGLAPSFCHDLHSFGLRLSGFIELVELADLVNLHLLGLPAEFAAPCQEPTDQLAASGSVSVWIAVGEDRGLLPL
jgi:hypothetical protein